MQVLEAMSADSGTNVTSLRVDGGMSANDLLMQLQSDLVGIDVGENAEGSYYCHGNE